MMDTPLLSAETIRPNTVHQMDALSLLRALPSGSVDAVISDPPYNMTELDFEQAIDWPVFWLEMRRVLSNPRAPVILFSQQPFTTDLICSNRKWWRYEIIWEKTMPVGFLDANRRPLRCHENIQVFGEQLPEYFPQMETTTALKPKAVKSESAKHYNDHNSRPEYVDDGTRYPRSVWKFAQRHTAFENTESLHPTQKPLPLMERAVLTFTKPGWLVVDPFAGSGTTLEAARNNNRRWLGCDTEPLYVERARRRLSFEYTLPMFATLEAVNQ